MNGETRGVQRFGKKLSLLANTPSSQYTFVGRGLSRKAKVVKAYILVNAKPGKVRDVARQIANIPGVTAANACWGMPDVFVVAEVASPEELNRLVIDKIQPLDGVERTDTHIAIE